MKKRPQDKGVKLQIVSLVLEVVRILFGLLGFGG